MDPDAPAPAGAVAPAVPLPRERDPGRPWLRAAPWLGEAAPAVLTLLCAAPAAAPLFRPGFPDTHDGKYHLFRLASLAMSIAQGGGYVRWSGQLDLGYGSPIFSYYAPLPYYGALAFTALGLDVTDALRSFFAAGLLLSALATYALGRELGGRAVGFAAGVSAAILPYQLHDVYVRGALGEAFALALMPLPLVGMLRYARSGRTSWLAAAAVAVGAIALSHNVSTLLSLPVLALWIAIVSLASRREARARATLALQLAASVALGLSLAAFFWLPAITETGLVRLDRVTAGYNFHDYFNRVWPPVQTSLLFDYRYDPSLFPVRPGLAQALLAVVGVAALAFRARARREARGTLWLAALGPAAILLLFLQRPASAFLWERVPLAAYVQFPYRLMGPFGLATALLTGFVPWLTKRWEARAAIALGVGALGLITSLGSLKPAYTTGLPPDLDERGLFAAEVASGNLGFTAGSEYVPAWVTAPTSQVIGAATRVPPNQPASARWAGEVRVLRESETATDLEVSSPTPQALVLRRFYMPQWQAEANGARLRTYPSGPLGLLAIDVPAGASRVRVRYGILGREYAAYAVSGVGALVSLALAVAGLGPRRRAARRIASLCTLALALASLASCAVGVGALSPPEMLSVAGADLAPGYQLVGARIDRSLVGATGTERVVLYALTHTSGIDLLFRLRATDESGRVRAEVAERPWNGSTAGWRPGEIGRAMLDLPLPGGDRGGTWSLSVSTADAMAPERTLATISLPPMSISPTPAQPYRALWANFDDAMAIRGYRVDVPEVGGALRMRPGAPVVVTLDMLSLKVFGGGEQETAFVHLLDGNGTLRAQHDELAGTATHPTSRWIQGEPVRQEFAMRLPPDAPPGAYRFEAGFYQLATMQRLPLLDATGERRGDALQFGSVAVGQTATAP